MFGESSNLKTASRVLLPMLCSDLVELPCHRHICAVASVSIFVLLCKLENHRHINKKVREYFHYFRNPTIRAHTSTIWPPSITTILSAACIVESLQKEGNMNQNLPSIYWNAEYRRPYLCAIIMTALWVFLSLLTARRTPYVQHMQWISDLKVPMC